MVVYFDDILIYSKSMVGHFFCLFLFLLQHVWMEIWTHYLLVGGRCLNQFNYAQVDRTLDTPLCPYINIKKVSLPNPWNILSRLIMGRRGINMDPKKIQAISEWLQLLAVRDIQGFLGLASSYRKFIKHFSTITTPLTNCLKKEKFQWGKNKQQVFTLLKANLVKV